MGASSGRLRVGVDISPGTWVASAVQGCRWNRLSGFGGLYDSGIESGAAPAVSIEPTDVAFESNGCGTWTKAG
jgi:hypothetical protein